MILLMWRGGRVDRRGILANAAGTGAQWNEMRVGGQYVANTGPIRFLRGTDPQTRESHDSRRLSPIMKYSPCGTVQTPTWPPRRSGFTYDSSSSFPSIRSRVPS